MPTPIYAVILTEDDLRNLTPELLDKWFPAWRAVASDILQLPLNNSNEPNEDAA
jgi:hypothetical protein